MHERAVLISGSPIKASLVMQSFLNSLPVGYTELFRRHRVQVTEENSARFRYTPISCWRPVSCRFPSGATALDALCGRPRNCTVCELAVATAESCCRV